MLFNSIEFAIFLPIVFLLYWFVFYRTVRLQNLFVVVASYVFYGWWDWRCLFLIVFTSLCSYGAGVFINKNKDQPSKAKAINVINIVVNLLILGVFKYYDFFATSFANVFLGGKADRLLLHAILPVGISFYTFQALSYSIDVYRGKLEPTQDMVQFFAYVSFFPQLVAGPIERASNLLPQFGKPRSFEYATGVDGMRQILWGLFKKMVVADSCAAYVNQVFATYQTQTGSTLLLAAVLFAFQIYGDFSGYSDIAIGTAKLFGIKLMRNFNVPYFSRDIAEFWRRWHISLTSWFRDYVYIPMGGSRCSKSKVVRNTFVIFLLSGLWHGANWTFVVWGAYHAILFLPLILADKNRRYRDTVSGERVLPTLKELCQMAITFLLVLIGWIIFRSETIGQAWIYLSRMMQWGTLKACYRFFISPDTYVESLLICFMLVVEWFQRKHPHGLYLDDSIKPLFRYGLYILIICLIVLFSGENQSFIYFAF